MTTAFVLSGGGSLGSVQVGMLQALREYGEQPDLLVGSSAGALNAAFVAGHGFDTAGLQALSRLWTEMRRRDVFPFDLRRQLMALAGARPSLCSADGICRLISRHIGFTHLEDATIPLHVVATDIASGLDVLLSEGDARAAVQASAAIPAILPSVEFDGRTLVDGGIANNTPLSHAVMLGADRVVVLPAGTPCALAKAPRTAIGVALQALSFLIAQRLSLDIAGYSREVEVIVLPPLCPVSVSLLDFSQARELIDRAHESSLRWLEAGPHQDQETLLAPHEHPELRDDGLTPDRGSAPTRQ